MIASHCKIVRSETIVRYFGLEVSYRTSLEVCVFSRVLDIMVVTLALVRGPMGGESV